MGKKELYDIHAILRHETEKAWLFDVGLDKPVWIPKSQGEWDGKSLTIPESLVIEKGMESLI